jgi:hypothetical protein
MASELVPLDAELLKRLRRLAEKRNTTIDDVVATAIDRLEPRPSKASRLIGLFADQPELVDAILEDVYRDRREGRLRRSHDE